MSDNSNGDQHDHATMHATADTEISNAVTESMGSKSKEKYFDIQLLKTDTDSIERVPFLNIKKCIMNLNTGNDGRKQMDSRPTLSSPAGYPVNAEKFYTDPNLTADTLAKNVLCGGENVEESSIGSPELTPKFNALRLEVDKLRYDALQKEENDEEISIESLESGLMGDNLKNVAFQREEIQTDSLQSEKTMKPSRVNDSRVSVDTPRTNLMAWEENCEDISKVLDSSRSDTPTAASFIDLRVSADTPKTVLMAEEKNGEYIGKVLDSPRSETLTAASFIDVSLSADTSKKVLIPREGKGEENGKVLKSPRSEKYFNELREENGEEMPLDSMKSVAPTQSLNGLMGDNHTNVVFQEEEIPRDSPESEKTMKPSSVNDARVSTETPKKVLMPKEENGEENGKVLYRPRSETPTAASLNNSSMSAAIPKKALMPGKENGEENGRVLDSPRSESPTTSIFNGRWPDCSIKKPVDGSTPIPLCNDSSCTELTSNVLDGEENKQEVSMDSSTPKTNLNGLMADNLTNVVLQEQEIPTDSPESERTMKPSNVNDSSGSAATPRKVPMHGEENDKENGKVFDSPRSDTPITSIFNGLMGDNLTNAVFQGEEIQTDSPDSEEIMKPSSVNDSRVSTETAKKVLMPEEENGEENCKILDNPRSETPTTSIVNEQLPVDSSTPIQLFNDSSCTDLTSNMFDGEENKQEVSMDSSTSTTNLNDSSGSAATPKKVPMHGEENDKENGNVLDSPMSETPTTSIFNDVSSTAELTSAVFDGDESEQELSADSPTLTTNINQLLLTAENLSNGLLHGDGNGEELPSNNTRSESTATHDNEEITDELLPDSPRSESPTTPSFNDISCLMAENIPMVVLHRSENGEEMPTYSLSSNTPARPNIRDMSCLMAENLHMVVLHGSENGEELPTHSLRSITPTRPNIRGRMVLVNENEYLTRRQLCIICQAREHNILFVPCHHHILCENCSDIVTYCPICKKTILKRVKTFR